MTTHITHNFTLEELTASELARAQCLDNTPDVAATSNLIVLAGEVLQPLRTMFGPIQVNGAYRSPEVNRLAGGVPKSQHLMGEAADIVPKLVPFRRVVDWTIDELEFDQIILEFERWIHVSFTRRRPNRRQALMAVVRGDAVDYIPYR